MPMGVIRLMAARVKPRQMRAKAGVTLTSQVPITTLTILNQFSALLRTPL